MRLLVVCLMWAGVAAAGPIALNQWYEFGFDPNHTPNVSGCQPADPGGVPCRAGIGSVNLDAPPWTFTAATAVSLSITDAFLAGDSFSVFDLGTLVGSTPAVPLTPVSCGFDPSVCFIDPAFSHATRLLQSGSHSITINFRPAQIQGEGFFRLQSVPEPSYIVVIAAFVLVLGGGERLLRRA